MTVHRAALERIELVRGDITHEATDAIVNAANEGLRGGGGVDGALHRAGGPAIMQECRNIGRCPTGTAVVTTGGRLKAKFVIHAVGPIYRDGESGEADLLRSAYRGGLQAAKERDLASVSFPSISTGVYGYPVEEAAEIALRTAADELSNAGSLKKVRFVLFDDRTLSAFSKAFDSLQAEAR